MKVLVLGARNWSQPFMLFPSDKPQRQGDPNVGPFKGSFAGRGSFRS
jgi:hypothetical protein